MNDRIARERAFHDTRFADEHGARPADRFYVVNRASNTYFQRIIDAAPPGARMLETGCGDGAYAALHATSRGLSVTAVDVSAVAIERARAEAERRGLAGRIVIRADDRPARGIGSPRLPEPCATLGVDDGHAADGAEGGVSHFGLSVDYGPQKV
jgi:SAM-dependent methyltransferase